MGYIEFLEGTDMRGLILTVFVMFLISHMSEGQEIDCSQFHQKSENEEEELVTVFESGPVPIIGFEELRKRLFISYAIAEGKVYVQFVVDTTDQVQCAKVVKTDNELLNDQAKALIEETKFSPAEQRSKKIVSIMVLPITFGPELQKEEQQKNKKR